MNNFSPFNNIPPSKTPEYENHSLLLKPNLNADHSFKPTPYPNSYNPPRETLHIYHNSPLKPLSYHNNSTPIRFASPVKINNDPENIENFHYLLNENEKLKFILKEKQDELYSFKAKCSHLEKHVKDPTFLIKLEENELKLQGIIRENQRLHNYLAQKQEEIESWKSSFIRIDATMNEKINEFECVNNELRAEIENSKKQIAELEKKLVLKEEMFTKYLSETKYEREENIKNAKQENTKKSSPCQDMLSEAQCNELIDKMNILIKENEKLNFLLEQKLEENDRLKNLADQQNYELDQWKIKCNQLNFSYEELKKKDLDDENKISKLTFELENINNLLRNKLRLIEDWKEKYLKLGSLSEQMKEFKEKIYNLTDDNVKLNSLGKCKGLEIDKLKENNHKLELQLTIEKGLVEEFKIKEVKMQCLEESLVNKNQRIEYENQISLLKSELERLNEIIRKMNSQIDLIEIDRGKMEFFKNENINLTKNLEEISQESANFRNQYQENHKLIQKNQEQNGLIVVFFAEIESLRSRVKEKEEELQNFKNKLYTQN